MSDLLAMKITHYGLSTDYIFWKNAAVAFILDAQIKRNPP